MHRCPRCRVALDKHKRDGIDYDVCPSCGGGAFAEGRLSAALGPGFDHWASQGRVRVRGTSRLVCPTSCTVEGNPMTALSIEGVDIDRCGRCGTVWLDDGEGLVLQETASGERVRPRAETPTIPMRVVKRVG